MTDPREAARAGLVSLFERYMSATGSGPTATSKRFAGDGSYFARLPEHRPHLRKASDIVRRFAEAWPANVEWPLEVERPSLEEPLATA